MWNGAFRDVVLGSCLLRKVASILHQMYRFVCVGGGRGEGVNKWGYETRKNVFYFTSKALFVLEQIKF